MFSSEEIRQAYKLNKRLKWEKEHPPDAAEMERLKGKYRLWKKLYKDGINCQHCCFNAKPLKSCHDANAHYDAILLEGYYCLAFLREGNYVK